MRVNKTAYICIKYIKYFKVPSICIILLISRQSQEIIREYQLGFQLKIEFQRDKYHCSPTYLPPPTTSQIRQNQQMVWDQTSRTRRPFTSHSVNMFPIQIDTFSFIIRFLLQQGQVFLFCIFWPKGAKYVPQKILFSPYLLEEEELSNMKLQTN